MPTKRNRRVALRKRKERLLVAVDALSVGAIHDDAARACDCRVSRTLCACDRSVRRSTNGRIGCKLSTRKGARPNAPIARCARAPRLFPVPTIAHVRARRARATDGDAPATASWRLSAPLPVVA
jgi:hypothetical protein